MDAKLPNAGRLHERDLTLEHLSTLASHNGARVFFESVLTHPADEHPSTSNSESKTHRRRSKENLIFGSPAFSHPLQIIGYELPSSFQLFWCRRTLMGAENDIIKFLERIITRPHLFFVITNIVIPYVDDSATNGASLQCLIKGFFLDDPPTAHINDDAIGPHPG